VESLNSHQIQQWWPRILMLVQWLITHVTKATFSWDPHRAPVCQLASIMSFHLSANVSHIFFFPVKRLRLQSIFMHAVFVIRNMTHRHSGGPNNWFSDSLPNFCISALCFSIFFPCIWFSSPCDLYQKLQIQNLVFNFTTHK
jgi:hypothetical protein